MRRLRRRRWAAFAENEGGGADCRPTWHRQSRLMPNTCLAPSTPRASLLQRRTQVPPMPSHGRPILARHPRHHPLPAPAPSACILA